ncbi:arginine deiminase-related protein [Knoellia sp. CPCC 206453]|uniref:arginine deiminase-related protein n=1 Tax=Knoellia pratensis TaxID=3404796 RepID=UPI00361CA65E
MVAVDIPTIELAGGSVRCMIAGAHLDRRPVAEVEPTAAVEAVDENAATADGQDVVSAN